MHKIRSKKKLGTYPSVGVIVSVTLALFVTGLFGLIILYSNQLEHAVRENIRVQVYLKTSVTESQRLQIEKKLAAMPYITGGASGIQFVSKDEAAKKFIQETGEDFIKFLGENPLHDAYLVNIDPAFHSDQQMKDIKTELEKNAGVFQVFYVEGLIEQVNKNAVRIGLVLVGIASVLLLTVVLLINNTIRLALFSQRFLVRSMQLVGARDWFIQRPFLLRASGYGLLAGVLASGLLWLLIQYANREIEDFSSLQNNDRILLLCGALMVLGILIAAMSTYAAMRRYLKMSLDELY